MSQGDPIESLEEMLPHTAHRGSNQSGMRAFNERLVLTLLRRHGRLSKSEIARVTGLSAQTVSVIMRQLEQEHLLIRGEPVRGKVGQPSVPMSLNPEGAFFLGLKIGRRSCELVCTDFLGSAVSHQHHAYPFPMPGAVIEFAREAVGQVSRKLGGKSGRIAGLGIAMPFELWNWSEEVGAPAEQMDAWRDFDIRQTIGEFCDWPIYLHNDATAACGAELVFGKHGHLQDFIYFYIGTFAGGGIVLNGSLYAGRSGNAGALGSMPVPGPNGTTMQLIDQASLVMLERQLVAKGIDPSPLWLADGDWAGLDGEVASWLAVAARGLAHAIIAAATIIDFQAALIDGGFPTSVRRELVRKTGEEMGRLDLQGIDAPVLEEGSIGPIARALGGASLPLFDRHLIDQNTLMRASV